MKVRVTLTEAAQEERLEAVRFYRAANVEAARYSLLYTLEENLIKVHAVPHHSRNPKYWLDRVRNRRGG